MPKTYRVGISEPYGPTMGWNEGGETTIRASSPDLALTLAEPWAGEGDYGDSPSRVKVRLTAQNTHEPTDRADRVIDIDYHP
jgi:hypothetical protein